MIRRIDSRLPLTALAILLMTSASACFAGEPAEKGTASSAVTAPEVQELLHFNRTITLTEAQQKTWQTALSKIPAPCCSSFTAATCCCECNMARALWGLAKHLIADEGADATRVEEEVRAWIAASNPDGYSGQACFRSACGKAFAKDGCGGMNEKQLVF